MFPRHFKWPSQDERPTRGHINETREYKFPNVIGFIDGSHINIQKPTEDSEDFFDRKQFDSAFYASCLSG